MTTTTPPLADLDRARDVAIELSGWGRRFVFWQPRNLAFWLYLILVGRGALAFLGWFGTEANAYGPAIVPAVFQGFALINRWPRIKNPRSPSRRLHPSRVPIVAESSSKPCLSSCSVSRANLAWSG